MKPILAILVAFVLLASPVAAQNTKVIPVSLTSVEGNNYSVYHFGYIYPKSQQIWRASAVTKSVALLSGLKYRRDTGSVKAAMAGRTYKTATFSVGHTSVAPETMSTTFANNIKAAMTKVLNAKALSLPTLPAVTTGPAAFNIGFNWTQPYIYDTTKGNLILQIELPGPDAKSSYFVDAERMAKGGTGTVTSFGTGGAFSTKESYKLSATAAGLAPGGNVDIRCGTFSKAYTGALVLGLSKTTWSGLSLPFDLKNIGAPNNNLYVSMDFQIPFATTGTGSSNASAFNAIIPLGSAYAGVTFHTQAWYADPNANSAGLVATEALTLTTATSNAPITQTVGHYNTTTATGSYIFGANYLGGPVIEFFGVIP